MSNIREELLTAAKNDSLFDTIYLLNSKNISDRSDVGKELASLHNQGDLNIVSIFSKLNRQAVGHKFFTIRHALEDALPQIDSPVLDVMQCVKHLIEQAGQDMPAGMLFTPFSAYCQANNNRPNIVLNLAIENEGWNDFVSPAIIAGAQINLTDYVKKSIELITEQNVEIGSQVIYALGRVNYDNNINLTAEVLELMRLMVQGEYNDKLFSVILRTSYSLFLANKKLEHDVSKLLAVILGNHGDVTLYVASEIFMFEKKTLPDSIVNHLLKSFEFINIEQLGTINNLDSGLEELLNNGQGDKAVNFLEVLLIKHGSSLSVSKFNNLARSIVEDKNNMLSKVVTDWFMSGVVRLGRAAYELMKNPEDKGIVISVDLKKLKKGDVGIHLFLARKACGWFFLKPVSATSFILSLVDSAPDDEVDKIMEILFNPLLISYSGSVKDYLKNISSKSSKKVKSVVGKLLLRLDNYHDGLKSAIELKEFQPSIAHREAYHRKMSREMSKSFKEAQRGSFLTELFSKPTVLLYGNSSIHYIHHGPDEEKSRQVTPMKSFSTSIEFPSLEYLAPYELDMMLRNFKLEGCSS